MKVIFLDIDGVLVNHNSLVISSGRRSQGDPDCVACLNRIIEATGAYIVVSSTWRFLGLMGMKDYLSEWGVKGKVLDVTPDLTRRAGSLYETTTRGNEIQAWLDGYTRYPIESFVILDDDSDMGDLTPYLVRTQFDAGLVETDALKAIELLQAKELEAA